MPGVDLERMGMAFAFYRIWHGVDAQFARVKAAAVDVWLPVATMAVACTLFDGRLQGLWQADNFPSVFVVTVSRWSGFVRLLDCLPWREAALSSDG